MTNYFSKKRILITGGASFIGSHLVEKLTNQAAHVRVVDDLSSGRKENINHLISSSSIEFIKGNLKDASVVKRAVKKIDLVFHLAGDHGGRGYVDLHQAGPATNMLLDGLIFWHAYKSGVGKIVFASSGCVYPNFLQKDHTKKLFLKEHYVGPPYDADNMYGWAKLMAEMTLKSYHDDWGLSSASCRFFTVYGPRGKEDHAVTAMIARAFIKQDPFIVWGNGKQVRNWTYVDDIVDGMIKAAEKINDGSAVNLGTRERVRVTDAVKLIQKYTGHRARIQLQPHMPSGPVNRVADNALAKKLLGWEPKVKFKDGVKKTIDWYFSTKNPKDVAKILDKALLERKVESKTRLSKSPQIVNGHKKLEKYSLPLA